MQVARHCQGSSALTHHREPLERKGINKPLIRRDLMKRTHFERFCRTLDNLIHMILNPLHSLVEVRLVITVQIGKMDFKPAKTTNAQWLCMIKHEQTTR